jgi:hypothetical protein
VFYVEKEPAHVQKFAGKYGRWRGQSVLVIGGLNNVRFWTD